MISMCMRGRAQQTQCADIIGVGASAAVVVVALAGGAEPAVDQWDAERLPLLFWRQERREGGKEGRKEGRKGISTVYSAVSWTMRPFSLWVAALLLLPPPSLLLLLLLAP